jgi:replicative DNA helicase
VLTDPAVLRHLVHVGVESFYSPRHQAIWNAIRNLEATSQPIDPVTVEAELGRLGKLDAVGGMAAIGEIFLKHSSVSSVEAYAATITDHENTRTAIRAVASILDALWKGEDDEHRGAAGLAWARSQLARVKMSGTDDGMTIGDVVRARMLELGELERRQASGETALTGVPTGVATLDEKLGGYQLEILTIVAGRTRMGKSSLLLAALNACSVAGVGVHEFSLEDSRSSHADRTLGAVGSVPVADLRALKLKREGFERLTRTANALIKRTNWRYDDRPSLTVPQIVESYRRAGESNGTKLVTVDYLNIVRSSLDPRAPRHEKLDQIATDLASAAKADRVALVAATQIGRSAMNRQGSRPALEDLKESGALEERCKCAVLVHRGSVYGDPVEGVDWDPSWQYPNDQRPTDEAWMSRADLIVAKNSNGPDGDVIATWEPQYMRFS